MVIINNITDKNYTQWIEKFTIDVLNRAGIKYKEIIIDDIEQNRRIFIFVDGEEYTIRTWNYHVVDYDTDGIPCSENVEYTLFKIVDGVNGNHGEDVDFGIIEIKWSNNVS